MFTLLNIILWILVVYLLLSIIFHGHHALKLHKMHQDIAEIRLLHPTSGFRPPRHSKSKSDPTGYDDADGSKNPSPVDTEFTDSWQSLQAHKQEANLPAYVPMHI